MNSDYLAILRAYAARADRPPLGEAVARLLEEWEQQAGELEMLREIAKGWPDVSPGPWRARYGTGALEKSP